MPTPSTSGPEADIPAAHRRPDPAEAASTCPFTIHPTTDEPQDRGLYRDRDGDIWQKTECGWRLCLQHGVAVDVWSLWEWTSGHVRDYGPFVPLATD
ncbi:hypothetical protein [Nocardia sp. NPDC052566]|uniref:hypothetical protein n=1 Tax=Nocardia sp. NPDC052566 TaxID=3364330 RepID=UPI0037C74E0D